MFQRAIFKSDFIPTLIYLGTREETRGYRRDLLTEDTPHNMKKFIFCSRCNGISRQPQFYDGKTFCKTCAADTNGTLDVRVEEFVTKLKCRCPLSTRGCDWLGELGSIEKHLTVCGKLRIECEIGCGEVLVRCRKNNHQNICPNRITQCDYCGQEVRASEANAHITLCQAHPDGEVTCPYQEMGCDVVGIKRKNLNAHLTENMINHQNLLLRVIHQLKSENEQLKFKSDTRNELIRQRRDVTMNKRMWMLVALVVFGIAILVSLLYTGSEMHTVIQLHKHSIQSNEQSIQSNKHSIQSNEQSINLLISRATYLYDYINDRGEVLQGIEWTHRVMKEEIIYGPIFSKRGCVLRLEVHLKQSTSMFLTAVYQLTRPFEDNEELHFTSVQCQITYVHMYSMDLRDSMSNFRVYSNMVDKDLEVGDTLDIYNFLFSSDETGMSDRIVRFYYDF